MFRAVFGCVVHHSISPLVFTPAQRVSFTYELRRMLSPKRETRAAPRRFEPVSDHHGRKKRNIRKSAESNAGKGRARTGDGASEKASGRVTIRDSRQIMQVKLRAKRFFEICRKKNRHIEITRAKQLAREKVSYLLYTKLGQPQSASGRKYCRPGKILRSL